LLVRVGAAGRGREWKEIGDEKGNRAPRGGGEGGSGADGTPGARERLASLLFRSVVVERVPAWRVRAGRGVSVALGKVYGVIGGWARGKGRMGGGRGVAGWRRPQGLTGGRVVPGFSGVKMGVMGGDGGCGGGGRRVKAWKMMGGSEVGGSAGCGMLGDGPGAMAGSRDEGGTGGGVMGGARRLHGFVCCFIGLAVGGVRTTSGRCGFRPVG